jgi:tetratricopeptide (TPR) repeat protein
MTIVAFVVLLGVDLAAAEWARRLERAADERGRDGVVPFSTLLPAIGTAVAAHALATWFLGGTMDLSSPTDRYVVVFGSVFCGMLPTVLFTRIFIETATHRSVSSVFGMGTAEPPESDMSKAKALQRQGDIDGALREYRRVFAERPASPRPLFEAELMLSKEGRYPDAIDLARGIMQRFRGDEAVWLRAARRLADLQEHNLKDPAAADPVLREIIQRAPHSDEAQLARARLAQRAART